MIPRRHLAERLARKLLSDNAIVGPPVDVIELARRAGAKVEFTPFEDDVSGILLNRPGNIVIGVNKKHATTRQRFTVAHEIGHLLLHHETPTVHIDNIAVSFRATGRTEVGDYREIEANAFAAELLIPREVIAIDLHGRAIDPQDDLAMKELADRYGVSAAALNIRLVELGHVGQLWEPEEPSSDPDAGEGS